jgi:hypothetical protein
MPQKPPSSDRQALMEYYLSKGGEEMSFQISYGGDDPENRTFSMEAIDATNNEILAFLGARIMNFWNEEKKPPHHCEINVTVELS